MLTKGNYHELAVYDPEKDAGITSNALELALEEQLTGDLGLLDWNQWPNKWTDEMIIKAHFVESGSLQEAETKLKYRRYRGYRYIQCFPIRNILIAAVNLF